MRASGPGQSALLMADVAEALARRGVRHAVIGAMAAAVHGVVRASLDADAIVGLQIREAQALRQSLIEEGYEVALRTGDVDNSIPGLLEIRDRYRNRVDLPLRLRGMDPELLNRTRQVRFGEAVLAIVSREDFVAMKAFAGGPVDLADARAVIGLDSWDWIASRRTWNRCDGLRSASGVMRRGSLRISSAPWTSRTPSVVAGLCDYLDR